GDGLEDFVVRAVSVAVVERLEAVYVRDEEGERALVALDTSPGTVELGLEGAPVAELGERVDEGDPAELLRLVHETPLAAPQTQEDAEARVELVQEDGLDAEVIPAALEGAHLLGHVSLRREEDDQKERLARE